MAAAGEAKDPDPSADWWKSIEGPRQWAILMVAVFAFGVSALVLISSKADRSDVKELIGKVHDLQRIVDRQTDHEAERAQALEKVRSSLDTLAASSKKELKAELRDEITMQVLEQLERTSRIVKNWVTLAATPPRPSAEPKRSTGAP
jgi:hypothetical protein